MRHTIPTCLFLAACAGRSQTSEVSAAPKIDVPVWLDRVPEQSGQICALGSAEPTFYREDGKIYAAENARTQLAATLSVRVESVMVDVQAANASQNYTDQQYLTEVQTFATDAVVAGAQIVSYWYDETGIRGRRHATYALACLDTAMSIADLNSRLQQAIPEAKQKNEAVRERSKALLDELDKQQTKPAKAPQD